MEVALLGNVDVLAAYTCYNTTSGSISSSCNIGNLLRGGYFGFIADVLTDPRVKDSSAATSFLIDQFAVGALLTALQTRAQVSSER